MSTIRKRGDKWQVQVRRRGLSQLTRSFPSRADALAWARSTEAKLDRADLPLNVRDLRSLTLGDLFDRYEREVTPSKKCAPIEMVRLATFRRMGLARIALDRAGPEVFSRFRDERLKTVGHEAIRRDLATLQHICETARKEWGIPLTRNPVAEVRKPPPSPARTRRLREGEWEQLQAALSKTRNKLLGQLLSCAVATGMRRGEMLAARWQDLDLKRRLLLLPSTKNGHPRHVPLSDKALASLEACRGLDPTRIFPIAPNAVRLAWDRLTKRAGIDDLHFHDLRHEAISRFFELGLTVPEVASISGHRDPRMLFRYAHADPALLAEKLS
jgi:integrase